MKKIDVMASIKDDQHASELNRGNFKVINASDNTNEANTYAIITQSEKYGACKVLITPNEALLEDLYRQAPNKYLRRNFSKEIIRIEKGEPSRLSFFIGIKQWVMK